MNLVKLSSSSASLHSLLDLLEYSETFHRFTLVRGTCMSDHSGGNTQITPGQLIQKKKLTLMCKKKIWNYLYKIIKTKGGSSAGPPGARPPV